uniref:Putative secreted protein n=1 Tax=Ixodes scapularis TaxID=6945 RepID=A0A4D5RF88_IXOSC
MNLAVLSPGLLLFVDLLSSPSPHSFLNNVLEEFHVMRSLGKGTGTGFATPCIHKQYADVNIRSPAILIKLPFSMSKATSANTHWSCEHGHC